MRKSYEYIYEKEKKHNKAKKKVSFIEYNIHEDPEKREEMLSKSNGAKTVPQIFIGNFHVGGNKELQILEREGKLDNILNN